MRLTRHVAPILLAGFTLSCGDTSTGITDSPDLGLDAKGQSSSLLSAKPDNAAGVEWRPFSFTIQGCTEDVDVSGFSHNLTKDQMRGVNGPTFFLMVSAQGFGVGQDTQARYVFSDKITYSQGETIGEGSYIGATRRFSLIGQGKVPNLHFYGVVELIFDGAGNVTIEVDQAHELCK